MTKVLLNNFSKYVFFILIFLLPINLGKHFILRTSFVSGMLIDYLVPTIYIQDILCIIILVSWLIAKRRGLFSNILLFFNLPFAQLSIFFLFSLLLSVFLSTAHVSSLVAYFRLILYFGIFFYVYYGIKKDDLLFCVKLLGITVSLVSILGILQFINQRSLFQNYLFLGLGEQPYTFSTWGIAKENYLGFFLIPPYGLFRHPNTFAGFLTISITLIVYYLKKFKYLHVPLVLGLLTILFTVSWGAFFAIIIGIGTFILIERFPEKQDLIKVYSYLLTVVLVSFLTFIPVFLRNSSNPSFYRRSGLLLGSLHLFIKHPLFGVGYNNLTAVIDNADVNFKDLRFTQPVHNIFVLVLTEDGIFAFVWFVGLIFLALKNQLNNANNPLFLLVLLEILILGSVDHYLLTMHQTLLLFCIILGLSFKKSIDF